MNSKIFILLLGSYLSTSVGNRTFFEYTLPSVFDLDIEENVCDKSKGMNSEILSFLNYITEKYLNECVNVILYDKKYEENDKTLYFDLEKMLKQFPSNFMNGQIPKEKKIESKILKPDENKCKNFLVLISDITRIVSLLGPLRFSKVVVVTISSRWKIEEFLEGGEARDIVNLLVVSYNWKQNVLFSLEENDDKIRDINLYTHNLYTDSLGSNSVRFLTSWRCGKLSRDVNLFPPKMRKGFNGKQFLIAASQQPPFTFKKKISVAEDSSESHLWDGVEIRLLRLLSNFLNYTIEIVEPRMHKDDINGPSETVIDEVVYGAAEIGSAGIYVTNERILKVMPSMSHTTDCAVFITKASIALPGHRAILGPFQWTVWLALTMIYLSAMIPIMFADTHSLKPVFKNPWLIEAMFWHVFGTFTNCFTFSEKKSWSKTKKFASRMFLGWYWAFTVIITACYTGCIVSFITLFVSSDVYDSVDQLMERNFQIGTLSTGGWSKWFNNSEHEKTKRLLRDLEFVPNTIQGLRNVSNSHYLPMFRPYAFLAGRSQLEYIVQKNFTTKKKKQKLHISEECFVPFGVSLIFPLTAVYSDSFNEYILRAQQSGLISKLLNEFKWEIQRSSSGKLLQAGSGTALREITPLQRKLTVEDMEGMYLLMGAGYLIGMVALMGEIIHSIMKNRKTISIREKLTFLEFCKTQDFRSLLVRRFSSIFLSLTERININKEFSETENNCSSPDAEVYDIRLLEVQYMKKLKNLRDSEDVSNFQINRKKKRFYASETLSLPDINKAGNSCNIQPNLSAGICNEISPCKKNLDIAFDSVNSLSRNFTDFIHVGFSKSFRRIQTC